MLCANGSALATKLPYRHISCGIQKMSQTFRDTRHLQLYQFKHLLHSYNQLSRMQMVSSGMPMLVSSRSSNFRLDIASLSLRMDNLSFET